MNYFLKSILTTVVLTLILNYSFAQVTITINSGDTQNGNLDLSDNGSHCDPYTTCVKQYDRITWMIGPNSNVQSIKLVHKKKGAPVIFVLGPSKDGDKWTGKVIFAPKDNYSYYITWTDVNGYSHTYDPKIAVNPKLNVAGIIAAIIAFIVAAFYGIRYLWRNFAK